MAICFFYNFVFRNLKVRVLLTFGFSSLASTAVSASTALVALAAQAIQTTGHRFFAIAGS
jgi:hypothetical protein